jgi:hypothetical protein
MAGTHIFLEDAMSGLPTLRDYSGRVITVECRACKVSAELDREELVKRYGAGVRFVELRRRLAIGCEKMICADGEDRCETRFPFLLNADVQFLKGADHEAEH